MSEGQNSEDSAKLQAVRTDLLTLDLNNVQVDIENVRIQYKDRTYGLRERKHGLQLRRIKDD